MPSRARARMAPILACLASLLPPAAAGAEPAPPPGPAVEVQRQANAAAARWARAAAARDELASRISGIEGEVAAAEQRVAGLRQAAMRGVVALYRQGDGLGASASALGTMDGSDALASARRSRLAGEVSGLARAAVEQLERATQSLRAERGALEQERAEQEQVVARLARERRSLEAQIRSLQRAEREAAASRARTAARAQAAGATVVPPVAVAPPTAPATPGGFICPIAGPVAFSDDFGGRRGHKGNDLMNPRGTPNVAVVSGSILTKPWSGGGLTIFLTGDDGNLYVYMHLLRFEGPLPRRVTQGEVIGLTGMTGNASAYHTHFEVRPGGGAALNPHPMIRGACTR